MDLVGNDVDTLHEEIEHLVGHLVGNDVDTLHEERIHLVGLALEEYKIVEMPWNLLITNCTRGSAFVGTARLR